MLDKFRETAITWDKANRKVYEPLRVSAGDNKGRKLSVQVVNGGVVEDLSGANLSLFWETRDKTNKGLDAFTAVDATKGEFELSYTTGMLSNEGTLNANLVLVDTSGRIVSEPFTITVFKGIDDEAIQSSDSFTALTQALIDINDLEQNYAPRLSTLEQNDVSLSQQLQQIVEQKEHTINVKQPIGTLLPACKVDGVTDDSDAFNAIYQYAYENGLSVFIPGTMLIKKKIGLSVSVSKGNSFPSILGHKATAVPNGEGFVQNGSIILVDGVGVSGLEINNQGGGGFFYGGTIKDIAIIKKDTYKATDGSTGLKLRGCVDYRLYNVSIIGFDTGFHNVFGFSWDTYGLTAINNNIGVLLDDNSNAVGIHGGQLHQNNINIKIISGITILLDKVTLEGQNSIACVITKGPTGNTPKNITIKDTYIEANSGGFIIGKDENGVSSTELIKLVSIDQAILNTPAIVPFELDFVTGVSISNVEWGHASNMVSTTNKTSRVSFNSVISDFGGVLGDSLTIKNTKGYKNNYNLIPNGFLESDVKLPFEGPLITGFVTLDNIRHVRVRVPSGLTDNIQTHKKIKIGRQMRGKKLTISTVAYRSEKINARIQVYDKNGSGVASAVIGVNKTKSTATFVCPNTDYLNVCVLVTNNSGLEDYVYIENICLNESFTETINPNPLTNFPVLIGEVLGITGGTVVELPGWDSDMYSVFLTPTITNMSVNVIKSNGSFTIRTSEPGYQIQYMVVANSGIY